MDRLKSAPGRVEDADGKVLDAQDVHLQRDWSGDLCRSTVTNTGKAPVRLGNIILFDLQGHGLDPATPIYGEGFQMLAQTSGPIAKPDFFGPYPDAKHYRIPQPDNLPTVYGMMTFDLGGGGQALLGFTSCRRFIGRFSFDARVLRVSLDPEGLELRPGETWKLEEFLAVCGPDRNALLGQLADGICRNHPPLPPPPLENRAGWCTWYGVGEAVNQKIVTESAARLATVLPELKFIQIDAGFSKKVGDWLEVAPAFGDLGLTVDAIRAKGFLPGLWFAPFIAQPDSETLRDHPDWYVQGSDGKPLNSGTLSYGGWSHGPWRVLDGTNPEAQKYLETVFRTMREKYGVTYFKLDANCWGAIRGGQHFDPRATRVEAYRRGMEAVLRGAGPGAVILGCNAPLWPSFGLVNALRTSNDIARSWNSFAGTARENLNRGWQNGRLWVNDPDCVVLAGNPGIAPNVWQLHATVVHAVGGLVLTGDKIDNLGPEQLATLRKLTPPTGRSARFDSASHETGVTDLGDRQYYYAFQLVENAGGPDHPPKSTFPTQGFLDR